MDIPTIIFVESDGSERRVDAPVDRTLMQIAVDGGVAGVLGECGGSCTCGTCHGYIDARWLDKLGPMSESESFMLEIVLEPKTNSRLCCQLRMRADLDGMVVQLPVEQG